MTDWNWDVWRDSWYSEQNGGANLGNGLGPRLQSGRALGTDDYDNRFAISFQEPAGFDYGETVVSATVYMKARGTNGCFSKGSAPKLLVRRFLDPDEVVSENSQSGECNLSGAGGAATEWPGPDSEDDDSAFWAGDPAAGTIINIDVTDAFVAWVAAKAGGTDKFGLTFDPSNAAGTAPEFISARKVAFSSSDADGDPIFSGGLGPYLKVVTSSSEAFVPPAPIPDSPSEGQTIAQMGGLRGFLLLYDSLPDWALSNAQVRIAKSDHVDGDGMLDTNVVYAGGTDLEYYDSTSYDCYVPFDSIDDPTTEQRGVPYYWQSRYMMSSTGIIPEDSDWSEWSEVFDYIVNVLPIATKVRPA